jgi:hypothetical protein
MLRDVEVPTLSRQRLTDGGEFVGLTHRPRSAHQNIYFYISDIHLCWRQFKPHGLVRLEILSNLIQLFTAWGLETATFRLITSDHFWVLLSVQTRNILCQSSVIYL